MDQQIKDRYTNLILQEAQRRYGIADDKIQSLDAFESFIFEYERDASAYILRLSHSLRRSEALIHGEVDWINYLAHHGVGVARAINSDRGHLVEPIADGQGGHFLATAFVKAPGKKAWDVPLTSELFEAYGELLGKMHALAPAYRLANPAWRRPSWNDPSFDFPGLYLPASESSALYKYRQLCAYLNALPQDSQSYGLVHLDAHFSNIFATPDNHLTLFDFDETSYSWFANDIAIALFYMLVDADNPPAFTREVMLPFLRGYRRVTSLDPKWLKEIPNFLKLRELELYAVVFRDFDIAHIDDPWFIHFMRNRKARIEADVPFVDFDFATLVAE